MEAVATTAQAVNNFKKGLKEELTAEQKRVLLPSFKYPLLGFYQGIAEIKKLVAVFKTEKSNDDEEIQKLEVMMKEKRAVSLIYPFELSFQLIFVRRSLTKGGKMPSPHLTVTNS